MEVQIVVLDDAIDLPDECHLVIECVDLPEITFMTEEEQGDDPESIDRWVKALHAAPTLSWTPEEEAEWEQWQRTVREFELNGPQWRLPVEEP